MSTAVPTEPTIRRVEVSDETITAHLVDGRVITRGYKPLLLSLQFEDDPIGVGRRKYGIPLLDPESFKNGPCKSRPDCVLTRPVTRDAQGVWRVTRDIQMVPE